MKSIRIDGSQVTILPVVKGPVFEADRVAEAFTALRPDAVAVSISHEELAGLRSAENFDDYEPSPLEEIYAAYLESFGEVRLPPPCYLRCLELCDASGVPLVPVDMNDEVYTETYCATVSTMDMIRESFFARRAGRGRYDMSTAETFAIQWDAKVNKNGFRELEKAREQHMANVLTKMARKYHNVLAIIEVERAEGVEHGLGSSVEVGGQAASAP